MTDAPDLLTASCLIPISDYLPHRDPVFGTLCTPEKPIGAPMVSSEDACAAYDQYGQVVFGV